jgi:hypothetical protein
MSEHQPLAELELTGLDDTAEEKVLCRSCQKLITNLDGYDGECGECADRTFTSGNPEPAGELTLEPQQTSGAGLEIGDAFEMPELPQYAGNQGTATFLGAKDDTHFYAVVHGSAQHVVLPFSLFSRPDPTINFRESNHLTQLIAEVHARLTGMGVPEDPSLLKRVDQLTDRLHRRQVRCHNLEMLLKRTLDLEVTANYDLSHRLLKTEITAVLKGNPEL